MKIHTVIKFYPEKGELHIVNSTSPKTQDVLIIPYFLKCQDGEYISTLQEASKVKMVKHLINAVGIPND